jgi:hypothetical protein
MLQHLHYTLRATFAEQRERLWCNALVFKNTIDGDPRGRATSGQAPHQIPRSQIFAAASNRFDPSPRPARHLRSPSERRFRQFASNRRTLFAESFVNCIHHVHSAFAVHRILDRPIEGVPCERCMTAFLARDGGQGVHDLRKCGSIKFVRRVMQFCSNFGSAACCCLGKLLGTCERVANKSFVAKLA